MTVPASGHYTPQRLFELVRQVRAGEACTPDVCREHAISGEEWAELNRRFDAGEMRLTRVQNLRRAA